MAESLKNWYVIRAIGGQENKVKTYIENEITRLGLSDYVDQVIVPTEKVIQKRTCLFSRLYNDSSQLKR